MSLLQRITHNLRDSHTWRIALPTDTRPARLVCRCGITKPIVIPEGQDRCFCCAPECVGWQAYVLHHHTTYGKAPTWDDALLDETLHTAYEELLDKIRAAGPPPSMREMLVRFQDRERRRSGGSPNPR